MENYFGLLLLCYLLYYFHFNLREREYVEDEIVDGIIILNRICNKQDEGRGLD
jgi:hypothetical protein